MQQYSVISLQAVTPSGAAQNPQLATNRVSGLVEGEKSISCFWRGWKRAQQLLIQFFIQYMFE